MTLSPQRSPKRRSGYAGSVCLAIGMAVAIFLMIADLRSPYANMTSAPVAGLVTVVVAAGGVALGALVRLLSATTASPAQWIRRSSAGALC
jgi:hypothetical protein